VDGALIRRTQSHLSGAGGRTLFRRAWLSAEPVRLVLLVHGYAEHSGRYEHVGAWLAARGCAVHAYDQQGHGRSEGPRGHVRRFGDLLDDLDHFLDLTRGEHPGLPAFVVGHSMGGLVVAAWARERKPEAAGAITSGAALRVAEVPSTGQRIALRLLRRVAPRLRMPRPIDPEALSRDPEVGRAYQADSLIFQTMTLALAAGLFEAAGRTLHGAADVELPMLLLHGGEDPLVEARGSRDFFEGLRSSGNDLRIYADLRHEIFNEPEWETVLADLLDWVRKREGG
jgi:alpha-beta hydrolase superfamily lysophospholipase